ncbi:hypothetical protein B0H10DRAFT_2441191 [Mycena sp. CBHHK59/15]|nr:hypothetical protein B0H10DRAFT_2441191 [Mycena sp. CBHHK59/15]
MAAKSKAQTRGASTATTSARKRKQTADSASAPATKKPNRRATVEEVEDEDAPPIRLTSNSAGASATKRANQATVEEVDDEDEHKPLVTKNPIYLFYEVVPKNSVGYNSAPGDKHYKCYHGNRQIITISKASRSNLSSECCLRFFIAQFLT